MAKKAFVQFPNKTISFDITCDENTMDFFKRMQEEHVETQKAIQQRIKQLLDEFVDVVDKTTEQKAYDQVLKIFSIGYQLGWNDRKAVEEA